MSKAKLPLSEYGAEVERLLQAGGTLRQMERLQALRMGPEGKHSLQQINEAVGRATPTMKANVTGTTGIPPRVNQM